MHFHRQFCVDPTDGFWFISQTWVLDQFFSSVQRIAIKILTKYHCGIMLLKEQQYGRLPDKFWPQVIVDSCSGREIVQNIARQTLTTDYHGFMLPREQQYRTLPDKFWPQIITDSCFRESSSTEHCQTNYDHRLPRIHASERAAVQNIAKQILTTDYHGFMLPREHQYRTLPDKLWPQIAADSCFRERAVQKIAERKAVQNIAR